MLSKQAIDDFKKVYKETYGKDISDEKAEQAGTWLLEFLRLLTKDPIPYKDEPLLEILKRQHLADKNHK